MTQLDDEAAGVVEETTGSEEAGGNTGSDDGLQASTGALDQQAEPDTGAEASESAETAKPEVTPEQVTKLLKENGRMARALDSMNQRLSALKAEKAGAKAPTGQDIDVSEKVARPDVPGRGTHPLTRFGYDVDEEGTVFYKGRFQNADDVLELVQLREGQQRLERELQRRDDAAAQAKAEADERASLEAANKAIEHDVKLVLDSAVPGLANDEGTRETVTALAENQFLRLRMQGVAISNEMVAQIVTDACNRVMAVSSRLVNKQVADNEEHRDKFRVKTGGQAGTEAPKTQHNMTPKQLEAAAERAFRRATSGE